MSLKIDKSGINLELGDDVKKYIDKKIGRLNRYVPRQARKSMHVDVKIREANNKAGNKYECEVIVHLPGAQVTAKESTINMFAAIDIVEAKLKNQLHKYKQAYVEHLRDRRFGTIRRLRGKLFARRRLGDQ